MWELARDQRRIGCTYHSILVSFPAKSVKPFHGTDLRLVPVHEPASSALLNAPTVYMDRLSASMCP